MNQGFELKIEDWFLGQSHRDDEVGRLSRLWVLEGNSSPPKELSQWFQERKEGGILREAVEEALREYSIAKSDLSLGKRTKTFPYRFIKRENEGDRWKFHKNHPEISADDYLHFKQQSLSKWISERDVVYLDMFHWIKLRHVILGDSKATELYRKTLDVLREKVTSGRILCPASFPLFLELMKQTDDRTRIATAELMDELGLGVCLQSPHEIAKIELRRVISKGVFGANASSYREWVWTKAAWLMGIVIPDSVDWDVATRTLIQKVGIDAMWESKLSDLIEELPQAEFPQEDYSAYLAAYAGDKNFYEKNPEPFEKVLEKEKAFLWHSLMKKHFYEIARSFITQFPEQCAEAVKRGPSITGFDPQILPSMQVKAEIYADFMFNKRELIENDLLDADHVAAAIPHCQVFAFEKKMGNRIIQSPLKLDVVYGVKVIPSAKQLLAFLQTYN